MKQVKTLNEHIYCRAFNCKTLKSEISESIEKVNVYQIIKGQTNGIENLICLADNEKEFLNKEIYLETILKIHKRTLQLNNILLDGNYFKRKH